MHCSHFSQRAEHAVQDSGPDRWNIKRVPPSTLGRILSQHSTSKVSSGGQAAVSAHIAAAVCVVPPSICSPGNVPCAVQDKLKCCVLVSASRAVPLWADLLFMGFCKYKHKLLLVAPSWFSWCLSELGDKPRRENAPCPWGPEPAGVPGSGWCLPAGEQGWFWDDEQHKGYPKARAARLSQQQTSALPRVPVPDLLGPVWPSSWISSELMVTGVADGFWLPELQISQIPKFLWPEFHSSCSSSGQVPVSLPCCFFVPWGQSQSQTLRSALRAECQSWRRAVIAQPQAARGWVPEPLSCWMAVSARRWQTHPSQLLLLTVTCCCLQGCCQQRHPKPSAGTAAQHIWLQPALSQESTGLQISSRASVLNSVLTSALPSPGSPWAAPEVLWRWSSPDISFFWQNVPCLWCFSSDSLLHHQLVWLSLPQSKFDNTLILEDLYMEEINVQLVWRKWFSSGAVSVLPWLLQSCG